MSVFSFFSRGIERPADRAALRDAQLHLPPLSAPEVDYYWFGQAVTGPLKYAVGVWPFRFTQEEMGAASLFCSSPENTLLDGPDRVAALGELDYIGNMVLNVETVALIVENRDSTDMRFLVLGMNNGSHLCSCRTLQIVGLCCRHFWMAMRLSRRFKFHVGILNQHWLVEQGRKPIGDWPEAVRPKWAVALNHRSLGAEEIVIETPLVAIGGEGGQWESTAEGATIGSSLKEIQEKGASAQDRRLLYVDLVKRTTVAVGVGVGAVNPDTLRELVASFELQVRDAARRDLAAGRAMSSPDASVQLPPNISSGKRPRESH